MSTCDVSIVQKAMGIQQTGPRTVIVPADPIIWSNETSYEYLTLVASTDFGQGYISKKNVPAGTPLTDTDYWIPVAQYNAQLAQIQKEISAMTERINENTNNIKNIANYLTPEMYGAKGDGVTDDGDALNEMFSNASGKICFLSGVYGTTKPINIPDNVNVTGVSMYSSSQSTIKAIGGWTPNTSLITIGRACTFDNIFLWGIQDPETNMTGITYNNSSDDCELSMFDCTIFWFNRGVVVSGRNHRFQNTMFSNCNWCCLVSNNKSIELRDTLFIDCRFHADSVCVDTSGITTYLSNELSINFIGCEFERCSNYYIGVGDGLVFNGCKAISIVRTLVTDITIPIYITNQINPNRGISILNCYFDFYRSGYDAQKQFSWVIYIAKTLAYLKIGNSTFNYFKTNLISFADDANVTHLQINGNYIKKINYDNTMIQKLDHHTPNALIVGNYIDSDASVINSFPTYENANSLLSGNLTNAKISE